MIAEGYLGSREIFLSNHSIGELKSDRIIYKIAERLNWDRQVTGALLFRDFGDLTLGTELDHLKTVDLPSISAIFGRHLRRVLKK